MKVHSVKLLTSALFYLFASMVFTLQPAMADTKKSDTDYRVTHYQSVKVGNLDIFYREAGNPSKPTLLLLHGFPTSSQMFRNLLPELADQYHLIAPDYPGFGQSSMPSRAEFDYTFENITNVIDEFTQKLGLKSYALYMMDYGGPVGFRLASRHPERIKALIVQNANAYDEGLGDFWIPLRQLWTDNSDAHRNALRPFLELPGTVFQYTHGVTDTTVLSPDAWTVDQYLLDRSGNKEIQLDLFYNYRTNVDLYPAWHDYFRTYQPPTLVIWGKNDVIFIADGATAFKRDLKNLDFHLLDAGHFVLESNLAEATYLIKRFLRRNIHD